MIIAIELAALTANYYMPKSNKHITKQINMERQKRRAKNAQHF